MGICSPQSWDGLKMSLLEVQLPLLSQGTRSLFGQWRLEKRENYTKTKRESMTEFLQGSAAFWFNMDKKGYRDPRTTHGGCPVLTGEVKCEVLSSWVIMLFFFFFLRVQMDLEQVDLLLWPVPKVSLWTELFRQGLTISEHLLNWYFTHLWCASSHIPYWTKKGNTTIFMW